MAKDFTQQQKTEMMRKIEAVVMEYWDILQQNMDDNLEDHDHHEEGWPDYDQTTPKMISGLVLVVNVQNMDNYGSLSVHTPPGQNVYQSIGMLDHGKELVD